jgi:hypothetical protein
VEGEGDFPVDGKVEREVESPEGDKIKSKF